MQMGSCKKANLLMCLRDGPPGCLELLRIWRRARFGSWIPVSSVHQLSSLRCPITASGNVDPFDLAEEHQHVWQSLRRNVTTCAFLVLARRACPTCS